MMMMMMMTSGDGYLQIMILGDRQVTTLGDNLWPTHAVEPGASGVGRPWWTVFPVEPKRCSQGEAQGEPMKIAWLGEDQVGCERENAKSYKQTNGS